MFERGMDELKFSEIVKEVNAAKGQVFPTSVRIAVLSNIIIEPLMPCLQYLCYREGIAADIYSAGYDMVLQEAMTAGSGIYRHDPEVIIVCLYMRNLSEKMVYHFAALSPAEIAEERARVLQYMELVLQEIRSKSKAVVLVHNFDTWTPPGLGIGDYQSGTGQLNTLRDINRGIVGLAEKNKGVYVVDVDLLKSIIGERRFLDSRYWHIGKAPYTKEAYKIIASEYLKFIRALKGMSKKCLVLDCDNVLWGGIIGEDGINKISIGATYPGSAYLEFQRTVLNLYSRGVMLAVCSKNNAEDVFEVLDKHPDMALKRHHLVATRVNWNDKATNIEEIAAELNIGLDSIVFVDDSEFEINLVKQKLPAVTAMRLPADPCQYAPFLNSCGLFDGLSLSEEDKSRSLMYQAEARRKKSKESFPGGDLPAYYKSLDMEVWINRADDFSVPRIAQLTQRTNQFNLTSKRYAEVDIKCLSEQKDAEVWYVRLQDRFGDYGIIGAVIVKYVAGSADIDAFLLSCRVIGRGVEEVVLRVCMEGARRRGCLFINGSYVPTEKNGQVEDFFPRHGFVLMESNGNEKKYSFDLQKEIFAGPDYFKRVTVGA